MSIHRHSEAAFKTVFETLRLLFLRGNDQAMRPEVDLASQGEAVVGSAVDAGPGRVVMTGLPDLKHSPEHAALTPLRMFPA